VVPVDFWNCEEGRKQGCQKTEEKQIVKHVSAHLDSRVKDGPTNVEVEAHADGVAGHEHVVARVLLVEEARLHRARLRGQLSVDHCALVLRLVLDLAPDGEDVGLGESHDAVAGLDLRVVAFEGLGLNPGRKGRTKKKKEMRSEPIG